MGGKTFEIHVDARRILCLSWRH